MLRYGFESRLAHHVSNHTAITVFKPQVAVADFMIVGLVIQHRTIELPIETATNMKVVFVCPISSPIKALVEIWKRRVDAKI